MIATSAAAMPSQPHEVLILQFRNRHDLAPELLREGVIRVAGTRVSLETVVTAFDSGATAEEIAQQYPSLELADVYAVISYVLRNRSVVDEYLRAREASVEALRTEIELRSAHDGIRARLLARRPSVTGG